MTDERFIGGWSLKSYEAICSDGRVTQPYGDAPYGKIIYDADGNLGVLLTASDREKFASDNPARSTPDEAKGAMDKMMAYCGTYAIDNEKQIVTHQLEASSFPNWENSDQVRIFTFDGNQLKLESLPTQFRDVTWTLSLVWERIEPQKRP
ncbi:MAG: lipocalin-like domain-containing protein [Chloroflexi bacterium]|nr:lipocalin-like domain-containing protein [Chloroflexota bacterium]MDA1227001.1 lipocalin-like domain-containing protein [Chloroflexota bacterium]